MKHFVKYDNYWWEYEPSNTLTNVTLYNRVGGRMTECNIEGMEVCQAESFADLNWEGTSVYDNKKYRSGWLAPNGDFYGCDYRNHEQLAMYVLHKSTRTLEKEGYIKITYEKTRNYKRYYILYNQEILPTAKQTKFLYDNFSDDRDSLDEMLWRIRVSKLAYERKKQQKNANDNNIEK